MSEIWQYWLYVFEKIRLFQLRRFHDVIRRTWYLGFTSFGGPPVHFQIFHSTFVERHGWIDDSLYQELFALVQALPGSASTKLLFVICWIRAGFVAAMLSFCFWCIPGAVGMFSLALGVSHIGERLPSPVYALLSGLNAATVGIIALAAVQLARNSVTDKLTRILVSIGGAAGSLYSALWYFPVMMVAAGFITLIWDLGILQRVGTYVLKRMHRIYRKSPRADLEENVKPTTHEDVSSKSEVSETGVGVEASGSSDGAGKVELLDWKIGMLVLGLFILSFISIIVIRAVLKKPPRGLALFANLYLAGTVIFGGGPVVIPLLREYIVSGGWVSPRDFLLGLAIIQSFPGPNFNFAVYLGTLAAAKTALHSGTGALIGFCGMFIPGFVLTIAFMGIWSTLRSRWWLQSLLRGVNAAAVGLIFAAVYRLWHVGLVSPYHTSGVSLGDDPWWIAVTAASFVGSAWFKLNAPCAILLGGILGLLWYAVVEA